MREKSFFACVGTVAMEIERALQLKNYADITWQTFRHPVSRGLWYLISTLRRYLPGAVTVEGLSN